MNKCHSNVGILLPNLHFVKICNLHYCDIYSLGTLTFLIILPQYGKTLGKSTSSIM